MTTRSGRLGALLLVTPLLLAGCGGAVERTTKAPTPTEAGLPEKTIAAGPVEVRVTPVRIDATKAVFALDLDNHQVELTGDYAAGSTLTVANRPWGTPTWYGDGPGEHHRAGTLTFPSLGMPRDGTVVLRIAELPARAELRWTLP